MHTGTTGIPIQAVERITRDISDGLILIDNSGTVQYLNPSASRLLGSEALKEGIKYATYMASDGNKANDAFHQYILDSVYENNVTHAGDVTYTRPDGGVRFFRMSTSRAFGEDDRQKAGMILQFSDVTALHEVKIKQEDTIRILVATITIMALWNYLFEIWEVAGKPISSTALTLIIEVIGVIAAVCAVRYTSISVAEFGLGPGNLKSAVIYDTCLTFAVFFVMVLVKLFLRRFFPNLISTDMPFFHWRAIGLLDLFYIPTVVLQEFLVRGVAQGSLERILPENCSPALAIIVSSLFFGSIHIHKGLIYMVGAAFLLAFFGVLYRKQKTIWGLCIPHLFLSWSLRILWGLG